MSQIHSALAYYWEHKEALDADIDRRLQYVEQTQDEAEASPIVAKLLAQGHLK